MTTLQHYRSITAERTEIESMLRCRTCNNLTAEDLPAAECDYSPSSNKSFRIKKQVGEFENSAALGCATCHMILEVLRRYIDNTGSEPSQALSGPKSIDLKGHYNEPLMIQFELLGMYRDIELFEERQNVKEEYAPLYPAVGFGNTPLEDLDIDFAARLASQWLSRCETEHKCIKGEDPFLPSRLLDLTSGSVKLITTTASTASRYAALSYCWGKSGNLTTTWDNLDERKAEIVWEDLPNLIQDVIQITRRLGIHYLWVDALCIIQDDRDDWRAESAKMGDVYAGAYLTIAVDAASDTSFRLTSPRNSTLRSSRSPHMYPLETSSGMRDKKGIEAVPPLVVDGRTHSFCVREPRNHRDIILPSTLHDVSFPLNTRGWALQERLFSSRVLHLAAHEMIWECKASLDCECKGILQDIGWNSGVKAPKAAFETAKGTISSDRAMMALPSWSVSGHMLQHLDFVAVWTGLVSAYSARNLTFKSDRLPAISALARHFSPGRTYLAGLWADELPWHLVWSCGEVDESRPESTNVYSGPTWSWASASKEVHWPRWTFESRSQIQILEASTAPMDLNEFGEVSWGKIRLRARVAVARISKARAGHRLVTSCGDRFHVEPDVGPNVNSSGSDQRTVYDVAEHEDVWCLLLFDNVPEPEFGFDDRSLWVMVAAKPSDKSIQRARLDLDAHEGIIVCERIGHVSQHDSLLDLSEEIWRWVDGPEYEEKEVILI